MGNAVPAELAPGVHLVTLGRGAAASNVYLVRSGSAWTLVDAGWGGDAEAIRTAAESVFGPGTRPDAILLTHIHPDHSGAAGTLARRWDVPVYVHPDELPMAPGKYVPEYSMPLDRWVVVPVMRLLPTRARERIEAAGSITDVVHALDPGGAVPGMPGWVCVPCPGHTPGHVAYLRAADGLLIAGDAALTVDLNSVRGALLGRQRVAGPPRYTTWDRQAAQRSIEVLANLQPRILAPGHGQPLTDGTSAALHALAEGSEERADRRWPDRLVRPFGYAGGDRYRPPPRLYSRLQWIGFALTRLGLSPAYVVTLEVPGRRTGVPRRTNLVLVRHEGDGYLVSLAGESEWVRNVRASGGRAVLARCGQRRDATLVAVPAQSRAAVIRAYLARAGRRPELARVRREARLYFGIHPGATDEEISAVADRYPVFRVVLD